jgi:hypothetical protein
LLQYKIMPAHSNHLTLLFLLLITLISSGFYLFAIYNPRKKMKYKQNNISSIKSAVIVILLLFCSFDAVVAGIVFVYQNISMSKSLAAIFIINLFMVLLPIMFKLLQKKTMLTISRHSHS